MVLEKVDSWPSAGNPGVRMSLYDHENGVLAARDLMGLFIRIDRPRAYFEVNP